MNFGASGRQGQEEERLLLTPDVAMRVQQRSLVVYTSSLTARTASHSAPVMPMRHVRVIQSVYLYSRAQEACGGRPVSSV
jgi:hypothetical protein